MQQFNDNDMQELKDIVRVGIVSSVNAGNMTARVKIQDQGIVTGDLKVVQNPPKAEIKIESGSCSAVCKVIVKPWIPTVGQWVLCIFKPDGEGDGFILGGI